MWCRVDFPKNLFVAQVKRLPPGECSFVVVTFCYKNQWIFNISQNDKTDILKHAIKTNTF